MTELRLSDSEYLIIGVSGRIDSQNAEEFYSEIAALRAEHPGGQLILYCEGLRYISSAGLRVLLRLQKNEERRVIIRQANPEVTEILTVTGFHKVLLLERGDYNIQLPDGKVIDKISAEFADRMAVLSPEDLSMIDDQLRTVDTEGCEIVGKGTTGCVYRLGNEDIVKVYNRGMSLAAVIKEVMTSKKSFVRGIPTAISYAAVKAGDCYGAVFEKIRGGSLAKALRAEPEAYDYYAAGYADLFRTLHNTEVEPGAFPSAGQIFSDAAERCTGYYTDREIDLFRKVIAGIPERNTLVHRDFHPRNIMVSDRKLMLIDMADVCIGHPVFDWMGIIATHSFFADRFPEAVEHNMGLNPDECARLKDSLFHFYFPERNEAEIKAVIRQAELYSGVLLGISPALRPEQDEAVNLICVKEAREKLLPHAEELAENGKLLALFDEFSAKSLIQ